MFFAAGAAAFPKEAGAFSPKGQRGNILGKATSPKRKEVVKVSGGLGKWKKRGEEFLEVDISRTR